MSSRHICLQAQLLALRFVPGVVEVESAGILAAVLFFFGLLGFERGSLSGLGGGNLLFRLVKLRRGHEDRQLDQFFFGRLIAGRDENLGIEVGIGVGRDFLKLQGVLVAVVGNDMNVGRAVREFWLDADKAAGNVAAIEDPVHRVAGKDVGDLLLRGKLDQRRLQESRADHRGSGALRTPRWCAVRSAQGVSGPAAHE